ncbi:MAG TPA: hypothetical protein VK186_23950 [Candidatus Deferrimicrobium sp.]|nr:hypothetical protein [Candidatus Deferrimicrobium sp.]
MRQLLNDRELHELMQSPKEFLGNPENLKKLLGTELASDNDIREQIIKKERMDPQELSIKMGGLAAGGVQEYYAVTSVVKFRSRINEMEQMHQQPMVKL